MKYIKLFESEKEPYIGLKSGDIVYMMEDSICRKDTPYRITDVVELREHTNKKKKRVEKDSDFLQVSDMNGNMVKDSDGDTMIFYAHRFLPELEYNLMKYKL